MKDTAIAVVGLIVILFLLWAFTPFGRGMINHRAYEIQKTDDATNYNTIKKVEDTARAMIASYESDKLMYEQYINSEKAGRIKQGTARIRRPARITITFCKTALFGATTSRQIFVQR